MRGETSSRGQNQNSWLGVTPLHILWLGCRFTLKLCASRLRSVPVQCWRPGHVWRKGCNQRPPHVCALLLFGKKTPTLSFLYFILLSVCIYFPEWGNPSFPPMHSFCLLQFSMCAPKKKHTWMKSDLCFSSKSHDNPVWPPSHHLRLPSFCSASFFPSYDNKKFHISYIRAAIPCTMLFSSWHPVEFTSEERRARASSGFWWMTSSRRSGARLDWWGRPRCDKKKQQGLLNWLTDSVCCVFQVCSHCKKKGACVGCCVKSCRKKIHFACSRGERFLCQFTGLFP